MFRFRSLRWRLTGWYVLLLAGVLLLFSAGIYIAVERLLLDNFDDVLRQQAELTAQTVDLTTGSLAPGPAVRLVGHGDDEHFLRLYGRDGTLLFDDQGGGELPVLAPAVTNALNGHEQFTQMRRRKEMLRVATFPISRGAQIVGVLQLGVSLEDIGDTMHILLKVLLVLAPLILLLVSGGGLFLANRALSPIDRITRTARRISAENLRGRINLRGPDDEVGRLAQTFDAMLARLEAAFAQQRQFTADAAHELRTPLTAIMGQIEVALDRPRESESYRATLTAVREQAQRLARLVGDLLFLARTDGHLAPMVRESIALDALLPAVVAQVAPLAEARDQTVELAPVPACVVWANEDQLIRLVLNLLDNAIRYTPASGRITLQCAATNGETVISVRDTGPGIAAEHLPRLFDRFFRIDPGRNRMQGGSGLGLAIAQNIAQAHGGRIRVESAVGQGSTFTVVVPSADQVDEEQLRGARWPGEIHPA